MKIYSSEYNPFLKYHSWLKNHSGSDVSVRDMATCIRFLAGGATKECGPKRLRIFTVRPLDDMGERQYVFEVAFDTAVFIGGDCTYFSGSGGYATQQMRSIFLALSSIYGLDIEEELVPHERLRQLDKRLLSDMGLEYLVRDLERA